MTILLSIKNNSYRRIFSAQACSRIRSKSSLCDVTISYCFGHIICHHIILLKKLLKETITLCQYLINTVLVRSPTLLTVIQNNSLRFRSDDNSDTCESRGFQKLIDLTEVPYEVAYYSNYNYTSFYSDDDYDPDNYDPADLYVFPNRTQYSKLGNFLAISANGRKRKTIFHDILNDLVNNLCAKSFLFKEIRHQRNRFHQSFLDKTIFELSFVNPLLNQFQFKRFDTDLFESVELISSMFNFIHSSAIRNIPRAKVIERETSGCSYVEEGCW